MKKLLKAITILNSGIYAKPNLPGEVFYVQARHFDEAGNFDRTLKPDLTLEGKIEKHLLQPGDILLAVKGYNNFAVQYQSPMAKAVASSVFIVIRIKDTRAITPDYLQWYLNHPQTKAWFRRQSRGTDLPSLTQESLENLELTVPSPQRQKTAVEMNALMKKAQGLQQRIDSLRDHRNQRLLLQAINSASLP